jgi:hypothetical protein
MKPANQEAAWWLANAVFGEDGGKMVAKLAG